MAVNSLTGVSSLYSNALSEFGLSGWSLKSGKYNGCTFAVFVPIPIIGNSQIYKEGTNIVALYNQKTGQNLLKTDPNGTGNLYNTIIGTLHWRDRLVLQIVTKQLPYANRCNTEDTGTGGREFKFTILFLGDNYQLGIANLENAILNPPSGTQYLQLEHPTRGIIPGITRCTDFEINTDFAKWNAATVDITFRSEQSDAQNKTVDKVKFITQSITTGLATVTAIRGAVTAFSTLLGNGVTTTSTTASPASYTTITNIETSNKTTSNVMFNSMAYIYQSSNTGISNSTLQKTTIDYSYLPASLNQNPPYTVSTADIIMQHYVNQVETTITLINSYNLGGIVNEMINLLNTSITTLSNVASSMTPPTSNLIYTVPNLMSLREVLARNNISLSEISNVVKINRDLLSVNYILAGTRVNL
jgi:hypothetical protein